MSDTRLNRTLVCLIGIQVCINGCMAGVRMAAPLLALRMGHGAASVGMLLALFATVQLFLAVPAGRYADRHNLKNPIAWCAGFTVLGAGLAAAWPTFPVLCAAAMLTGAANGAAVISLQRHAGRLASDPVRLRLVFSWMAIAPSFANFVGPFLAGFLIDHTGFRVCFAVLAALAACSWLIVRQASELPSSGSDGLQAQRSAWDLLGDSRMRVLLLVNWLLASCWDVHAFVLPILGHERGISASVIGTIFGLFAIAATVVRLFLPSIVAYVKEWAVIFGATVATAVLFGVYPLTQNAWTMAVCSILLGFSLGGVQPMIMSMLHQITPVHRQGEALGLRMISINVSNILTPLVFGSVGSAIGVASVFWLVGTTVACGTRAAWKLRSFGEAESPAPSPPSES
ncbi:MAG: MFS transporter [Candidatus Accumulibacter sp.]|jgi:predicted MFS family arabinose efflux permease|nr:MFS transporter [Accumulibacter sp.]